MIKLNRRYKFRWLACDVFELILFVIDFLARRFLMQLFRTVLLTVASLSLGGCIASTLPPIKKSTTISSLRKICSSTAKIDNPSAPFIKSQNETIPAKKCLFDKGPIYFSSEAWKSFNVALKTYDPYTTVDPFPGKDSPSKINTFMLSGREKDSTDVVFRVLSYDGHQWTSRLFDS